VALGLLVPGTAAAQSLPSSAPTQGTLRGIVFSATGAPRAGVRINVGSVEVESNGDGAFSTQVPPGEHVIRVATEGTRRAAGKARVVAGETTEILITLLEGKPPLLVVEAPGKEARKAARRAAGPTVAIRGKLVDAQKGRPVKDARVFARGTDAEATSGADGLFTIRLPAGKQELTIIHPGFSTEQLPVEVRPGGGTRTLEVKLMPAAVQLADFEVTAPRIVGGTASLLEVRRAASTVTDVIGAEQMSKSGDSDAAAALGRVPGITVIGGKYVYIRGLGERYSATVLNLSTLPSPEPERRVVPLDMFPVGVLEDITIQKTYTPDLPGDFSGGMVKLRTRGFPAKFMASIGTSVGFNDASAFRHGPMAEGGDLDWLGFGAGSRRLPDVIKAAADKGQIQEYNHITNPGGYRPEDLEAFGEALPNNWDASTKRLMPDVGLNGTLGDSFKLGSHKAGYLVSFGYSRKWRRTVRDSLLPNVAVGAGKELEIYDDLSSEEVLHEAKLSGIGATGVDLFGGRQKLRVAALMVRIGEDETRMIEGFDRDADTEKRGTRMWYRERMLLFNQITGEHELRKLTERTSLGLQLDWRYAFSMATLDEPDRRSTRYDEEKSGVFDLSNRPDGNQRFYSELQDMNHDVSMDLTGSFRQWLKLKTTLKTGFAFASGDREVDTRRFRFGGRPTDASVLSLPPGELFTPRYINENEFQFEENTRATDNYSAEQQLWATYLMADIPLLKPLSILAGARVESMFRKVVTADPFAVDARPIFGPCDKEKVEECTEEPDAVLDLLPAAIVSYRPFGPKHVFRLGYSRTLNRPQVRELSPAPFDDPDTGIQYEGNPRLRQAVLDNVDLRWEWYPSRMESISVAAFYKHFTDPIETVAITSAAVTVTPDNAQGANNFGAEIEVRKKLDFVHRRLRDVTLGGNASVVFSRVTLDPDTATAVTNETRPLQGQSPWVFNFFLSYDNVDTGSVVRLLYNVFGPRISAVGTNGVPDTYEQPYHRLDLVASQRLWDHLSVSLKASNLINHLAKWTLEDPRTGKEFLVDGFYRGRVFSLSLSASY
jgi:hypothetical protein